MLIRKDLAGLTFARWTLETGRRQVPSLRLERRIIAGRRGGNPAGLDCIFDDGLVPSSGFGCQVFGSLIGVAGRDIPGH